MAKVDELLRPERFWREPGKLFEALAQDERVSCGCHHVTLNELAVLDVRIPRGGRSWPEWPEERLWFRPETCARHLFVGGDALLGSLPKEITSRACQVYRGADGYRFLVETAAGLQNRHDPGEYHSLGEMKERWFEFLETHRSAPYRITKIMNWAIEDAKSIRSEVLTGLRPCGREESAKILSRTGPHEDVLIFGGAVGDVLKLAKTLGKSCSNRVRTITVAHPEPHKLELLKDTFKGAIDRRKIEAPVAFITWRALEGRGLSGFHSVFVCAPMHGIANGAAQGDKGIDAWLRESWLRKERIGGTLVHMRGVGARGGETTPEWEPLINKNFIRPELVQDHFRSGLQEFKALLESGRRAAQNCATSRSLGLRPIRESLPALPHVYAEDLARSRPISAIELQWAMEFHGVKLSAAKST